MIPLRRATLPRLMLATAVSLLPAQAAFARAAGSEPGPTEAEETRGDLVDEVVCSVNGAPITRTRVEQEARIRLAQSGDLRGGELDTKLLAAELEEMITRELLRQEMERFRSDKNEDREKIGDDVPAEFRRKFPDEGYFRLFLRTLGISERTLALRLAIDAQIDRFVEDRLKLTVRLDEDEVNQRLRVAAARSFIAADEMESLKKKIRNEMLKQKRREAFLKWRNDLAEKARIYQLGGFDKKPAVGSGRSGGGANP